MDRAETAGLGVALAGHAALLAILSLGFASVRQPPILNEPMEVSFVEEVAIRSAAPSTAAPAPSIAPEVGPPEELAPAEPLAPEPQPVPPPPQLKPVPKAVVAPTKSAPATPESKPAAPRTASPALNGRAESARGSLLGRDFLKGIGKDPTPAKAAVATGAVMSAIALSGIKSAIQRQIQPCADRQVDPGPGANRIQVTLNLKLNRDGSLAQRPSVVRTSGVTDENGRYEKRVTDLAIATYTGCAPLRGLPADLYQTAGGGWSNINMNYKLPG